MHRVFETRRNAALYAYWQRLSGNEAVPHRKALEPAEIAPLLPYSYLLKPEDHAGLPQFRFALFGGELARGVNRDYAGETVEDMQLGGWQREMLTGLRLCFRTALPVVGLHCVSLSSGTTFCIEHLALPLRDDEVEIARILGGFDYTEVVGGDVEQALGELAAASKVDYRVRKRLLIQSLSELDIAP